MEDGDEGVAVKLRGGLVDLARSLATHPLHRGVREQRERADARREQ